MNLKMFHVKQFAVGVMDLVRTIATSNGDANIARERDQVMIEARPIEAVVREHKGHFFDESALRFFKSRIHFRAWKLGDTYYFITSEKHRDEPRGWTVRSQTNGQVESVSEFQQFDSIKKAQQYLRDYLSQFDQAPEKVVSG